MRVAEDEVVIALWNEGMMPESIADKLQKELDIVERIIENPANYGGER